MRRNNLKNENKLSNNSPDNAPSHKKFGAWDSMLKKKEFQWKNPLPCVEDFINILKKEKKKTVCDLGCGAGRHTILLSKNGLSVFALDKSPNGLSVTKQWLKKEKLKATTLKCNLPSIPLISGSMEGILATNVIHHDIMKNIIKSVMEIYRVLTLGGIVLVTVISQKDFRYGSGKEIEKNTFIDCVGPEKGIAHHFFNEAELSKLFSNFSEVIHIGYIKSLYEYFDENGQKFIGDLLLGIFRK